MKLVNKTGYLKGAKTAKNPVNIIPSSLITTQGMAFPIKANGKTLYPNTGQYKFPTSHVIETPLKKKGADELVPNKMSKTSLPKSQEIAYQKWMKFKGYNESDDYDMRGYWKKEGFKNLGSPKGGKHFTDEFKRLAPFSEGDGYPTLSDESNVASKFDKRRQGTWTNKGKYINYQEGTEELKASEAAKFTYRIKDKKRRDTQVRDMYNNTLDSFRGDTTGAKRHFKDFFTHYGSERFNDVKPLEGYYGFDMKDYDDKTLDSLGRDWHKQMKAPKKQKGTKSTKIKREPEFGAGLFGNLFGKAGNPVVDKKENAKQRQEFEAATKRGLSFEGLGDLAMGLSGEAIAGAATKIGSKLYKAASPYVKQAYNVAKGYGGDLIEASKQAGKFKLPTYSNAYRWHADEIPEGLKAAGSKLTAEQQAHTGKWFATDINEIPFYNITRPSAGNLKTYRASNVKLDKLKEAMPASARGMSGTNNTVAAQEYKHPKEFLLPDSEVSKVKNIRFDKNPAVTASEKPEVAKILNDPDLANAKEYKRNALTHYILPELKQATQGLNKPILGIDRKYFPFKKGTKDMKPLVKYKDGSKSVSLAFSRGEKDPKGGLTQKGVDKYNRATGGNLKMAVTTPPSKLKAGSKPANRRKSFCARMGGMPGPMKKPNGEPSRKALALRKWNC